MLVVIGLLASLSLAQIDADDSVVVTNEEDEVCFLHRLMHHILAL